MCKTRWAALVLVATALACGTRSADGCEDEANPAVAEVDPAPVEVTPIEVVDAKALLVEARRLQFQDPAAAHAKAEASYQAEPTREALFVMGFTACRLRDAAKMRAAVAKFDDPYDATRMREHCESKGVVL